MWKSALILVAVIAIAHAQLDMLTDKMDFEDNIAEESQSDEQIFTNAIASKPLLNDGKPFYVARDPTTGTLDFNVKKTVGISNDIPISRKDELSGGTKSGHDINSLGHNNFHDYLNLPVKYSSSKFVYPLISGSYANLKYQGNNKNHMSNHKNYTTTLGTTTQSPKYFTHVTSPATIKHPETTPKKLSTPQSTAAQTSQRPTQRVTTTEGTTSAPQTTQSTTVKYSSTIVQNQFPSTFKNKYIDSSETRKKTTVATTSTKSPEPSTLPANPVKFIDDLIQSIERNDERMKETIPTTYRPYLDVTKLSFSTSMPLLPSAFKPIPKESAQNQSQKISFEQGSKNPSIMSLSEIINSFTGNDNLSNEQNSIPYETADSSQIEIKKLPPPTTRGPISQLVNQHKTLQQQMQNQQHVKPQFVDLPVHSPTGFPPASHIGFPNVEDYVEFENPEDSQYANQFVKYEVQKPNTNLVKFQKAPSMNNVVISPGQNSASFVLGSQQAVGSMSVGSSLGVGTSHFADNSGPMKVGQVINDEPPIRSPLNPAANQMQGSIRFPTDAENSFENAQIVKGTIRLDGSSESVQPPQALLQNQPQTQKPLVFPSNEHRLGPDVMNAALSVGMPAPSAPNPSQIIFENVNDIYGKINDKMQKQEKIAVQDLSNNIQAGELMPPHLLTPPNPTQQRPYIRQQPPPHFNIRRPTMHNRPNIPGLPNILPQFRPNAKASQGHPQHYKDVGAHRVQMQGPGPYNRQYQPQVSLPKVGLPSMQAPQNFNPNQNPNYRRLPSRPYVTRQNGPSHPPQQNPNFRQQNPSFNQQPNPNFNQPQNQNFNQPQNQNLHQNVEPANRRVFQAQPQQMNDRVFMNAPPPPPSNNHPGFQLKRPQNGAPETMQMQQRPTNIPQPAEFELNKSSPPPPAIPTQAKQVESGEESNNTRLEPVITLQMLQNKKGASGSKLNLPPVPHDIPQDIQASISSNHKDDDSKKPSIYVVYPVTSNSFENSGSFESSSDNYDPSVVLANRGDLQIPGVPEYQNTPFSVVSHFEQEPLLMKKEKKKNQFPYHLERPAPSNDMKFPQKFGQPHESFIYNTGETPTTHSRVVNKRPPYLGEHPDAAISSKLTRVTERPIAIAYTPTEPNRNYPPVTNFYHSAHPHHQYTHHFDSHLGNDKYSVPNYGGPVISEILDEKHIGYDYFHRQQQLQQHLNNGEDLDFYKEHYDFQAPFQASVSLTPEVTNPYEGWSIVTQSTDTNKIDRSDLHVGDSSEESTTRKFDLTEFQPVFESGFQPIYSGNKVSTAPELFPESSELPSTLALVTYSTHAITTTTTPLPPSTSSFETSLEPKSSEETTTSKVEKKKQKVEIDSLEAFFESLTRDYDEDESTNKSENEENL